MTCLSPEWDENIKFHFTVHKVNDGSLVYEESFENCQLDGTIGHAITEFGVSENKYYVIRKDKFMRSFNYKNDASLNIQKDFLNIFSHQNIGNIKVKLTLPDGTNQDVEFKEFYKTIKLK
ncbi:MAG: hypothetical protein IPN89_03770 [Saprospiraceae bacterium]|nr:hypothetical protein [Saprospiraceae bacterium]